MIKNKMKIVKDGPKIRVIISAIDVSSPPVQLVGHTYQFNAEIIQDLSFSAFEFSQLLGLNFMKGDIAWNE